MMGDMFPYRRKDGVFHRLQNMVDVGIVRH